MKEGDHMLSTSYLYVNQLINTLYTLASNLNTDLNGVLTKLIELDTLKYTNIDYVRASGYTDEDSYIKLLLKDKTENEFWESVNK